MVEAAYRHHGLDARYLNCEVAPEALADAVAGARAMGWAGFNCSLPHKVAVIEHLDRLAPSAEVIGAVNTVVATDGELVGHNTDGQGFVESLRTVVDPAGLEVVVLGAGGAARAVAVETALAGAASVIVVNRDATPRRGARPGRDRGHRGARDVRALGPHVCRARQRRRRRQRHLGRLRRRRRPRRRRPRQPAAGARRRRRRGLAAAHGAAAGRRGARRHAPSTASGCSSGRAPWRCGTGPVSTPTGRSCGPPRPRRWASRHTGSARPGLHETANRALPSSASPRRSSDESAARGRRKRTR